MTDVRHWVEERLTESELATLRALTRELGVPAEAWPTLGSVSVVFTTLASLRRARELEAGPRQLSRTEALQTAGQELGLARSTLPKRVDTWKTSARRTPHQEKER